MSIPKDRLVSLIKFAQQAARLNGASVARVEQHKQFKIFEHELLGLPGIQFDTGTSDAGDELWMTVARLQENKPPKLADALLAPWVELVNSPTTAPKLRNAVTGKDLIDAETHSEAYTKPKVDDNAPVCRISADESVMLVGYGREEYVRGAFKEYVGTKWKPWAELEQKRRKTIKLYTALFTLQQQMLEGVVDAPLEVVWGVGMGIWECGKETVSYPVMTRLCELALNPVTAAIEVKPRDTEPKLETDWYASVDNPGLGALEKTTKEFFGRATETFSPFVRTTFEPLLQAAVTHLDPTGVYWPHVVPPEDRMLPKAESKFQVTDTWVLFARPRTNSAYLADLDNFKKQIESDGETIVLPGAITEVVKDPLTINEDLVTPSYRGLSPVFGSGDATGSSKVQELYFPMAFNDEQVRIVQLLDVSNGVVVQGPPGTGKTHTIANVICHYLANGKRVLVTSMKDPALAVLQEKLPGEIQPLAISLLNSAAEGMKQFEHAITKIASEVPTIDQGALAREINHLEQEIDALHGKMNMVDYKVNQWAKKNLDRIEIDGEQVAPQDAAQEVVQQAGSFEWLPDALNIGPEYSPKFSDADLVRLRDARRQLGEDMVYRDATLPKVADFPDARLLLQTHEDLGRFTVLSQEVEAGEVPSLADSSAETVELLQKLEQHVTHLRNLRAEIAGVRQPWTAAVREKIRKAASDETLQLFESLGVELKMAADERKLYLTRPVEVPRDTDTDERLLEGLRNLAEGKRPFGLAGIFGKSEEKKKLDAIKVLASVPSSADDWKHALGYVTFQKKLRELAIRWNALAQEVMVCALPGTEPEHGLAAHTHFSVYEKLKIVVQVEETVCQHAKMVFPNWQSVRGLADNDNVLSELEQALRHHLTKNRLAGVWAVKAQFQKVLEGCSGAAVDSIRRFLQDTLGNPEVSDADMQSKWSSFMNELVRLHALNTQFAIVKQVTSVVRDSGASIYAQLLAEPLAGTVDHLIPDNWRNAWRLKRLSTYLVSIDAQEELKALAQKRREVENDLAKAYKDIVTKRTWLRLAEKTTPDIRSALMAYLTAIQRMGKGTGKRAVRYRQDARAAASSANAAVPCWIMPHYRIYESLPPEMGCFDLVIIDEASQSDLTALPALLRAKKVLVVGDDKQVSPEGVGLEEEKVRSLMNRFLGNQVETYRPQLSPERSLYDLFKVVFAKSTVMLKEHFRCVGPIIEYSKREFYNHELRPLRLPKAAERLDPPLIDVFVQDGFRKGDTNQAEARFIVDEIRRITEDPAMEKRSIGMVSLLADKQALKVWEMLTEELGPETMARHRIACGDAKTFQGKERDIMFLSMIVSPGEKFMALSKDTFAQRFNVAASRARDRMYLVRSVGADHLSTADMLRRGLIMHFTSPFAQDEVRVKDLRQLCESPFEREVYDILVERGYRVTPQVKVGQYRIDLVVEGNGDTLLAVECDGDRYHGADRWDADMRRQRVLERAGWIFWRCFASTFVRRKDAMVADLLKSLTERGIEPVGREDAPASIHVEQRIVTVLNSD